MSTKSLTLGGGISFCGLLTIVFITLKLIGKIDWAWLWVLSLIWIPMSIGLLILVGINIWLLLLCIKN